MESPSTEAEICEKEKRRKAWRDKEEEDEDEEKRKAEIRSEERKKEASKGTAHFLRHCCGVDGGGGFVSMAGSQSSGAALIPHSATSISGVNESKFR